MRLLPKPLCDFVRVHRGSEILRHEGEKLVTGVGLVGIGRVRSPLAIRGPFIIMTHHPATEVRLRAVVLPPVTVIEERRKRHSLGPRVRGARKAENTRRRHSLLPGDHYREQTQMYDSQEDQGDVPRRKEENLQLLK